MIGYISTPFSFNINKNTFSYSSITRWNADSHFYLSFCAAMSISHIFITILTPRTTSSPLTHRKIAMRRPGIAFHTQNWQCKNEFNKSPICQHRIASHSHERHHILQFQMRKPAVSMLYWGNEKKN